VKPPQRPGDLLIEPLYGTGTTLADPLEGKERDCRPFKSNRKKW
jgi:hypothetical protein